MKHSFITALAIISMGLMAFNLPLMAAETTTNAKPVIKIGAILPLTGNNAYMGENLRDGLLLRLGEVPADSKFNYKLVIEDDGFEVARTNMAVRKFKSWDNVDAVISLWGPGTSVVLPQLKGTSIIHLSIDRWSDAPFPYPYDFVVGGTRQHYTAAMFDLLKSIGVTKVAMFTNIMAGMVDYDRELKELLSKTDIKVVSYESVSMEARDFRIPILRAREAGAELVINGMVSPQSEILQRQMMEVGYHPIIGCPANYFMDAPAELVNECFEITTVPAGGEFSKNYENKFKKTQGYPAAFAYDALSLYIRACEQLPAGTKPTAAAISAEIRKTSNFSGALGLTNFETPNRLASPVSYYLIQNGQHKVVTLDELVNFYKNKK